MTTLKNILGTATGLVGSLCVLRKIFPYKNMRVDHVRPRRTRWHASPFVGIIHRLGTKMYPSASNGSVRVAVSFC